MNDTATPPAAPWSDPPRRGSSDEVRVIPPLTESERLVAEEPHARITCQQCGDAFRWELYAAHIEDEHSRGAAFMVRPPDQTLARDVRDIIVGLVLLALDRVRRRR